MKFSRAEISDVIIIEPDVFTDERGYFFESFKQNNYNINAYDIDPKKDYIQMKNFLELDISIYNNKNVHCIGNPPFGRQSSLAKQFIKKNALVVMV